MSIVAGGGNLIGSAGDGGPATRALFGDAYSVAISPDGELYIADGGGDFGNRIRRVASALPAFSVSDFALASEDGSELYQFSGNGRHLRTVNTLTGAVLYEFSYDSEGRLAQVRDGDNNITTIERDGSGNPTAIVGPFGQRTTLTLDTNGFLASVTNPANEAFHFSYTASGLLTSRTDPNGNVAQMTYDAEGRLVQDADAAGGSQNLARTDIPNGF
jgi:YD repeat-containing protein